MKKVISILLLSSCMFADNSSIERPSLNVGRDEQLEVLENIEHKLGVLTTELAIAKALFIETQRTNELLYSLNEGVMYLISEGKKTNDHLEHLLWIQDHRVTETKPPKKGP